MSYQKLIEYCTANKVDLIAVSKTRSLKQIQILYDKGQRDFGENRVQEWLDKKDQLPTDIRWHLIGTLQRNKVKSIIPGIHSIQSISNFRILDKVQEESSICDVQTNVLLQFKLSSEETKSGFIYGDIFNKEFDPIAYPNVVFQGVMGMATFTDENAVVRSDFAKLKGIFDDLNSRYFSDQETFKSISMGMSGDYKLAIEEGSNMLRIGSLLFNDMA